MLTESLISSPLRFPGGKSRVALKLISQFPEMNYYREPFVGGGSVFIALRQQQPDLNIWINDLNPEVYCFWKVAQQDLSGLISVVGQLWQKKTDGRSLYQQLVAMDLENTSEFMRAVRFFVLNRITFSGTTDSGGYSQSAFEERFTESSIKRLELMGAILPGIKITNLDYQKLLQEPGKETFLFLDPPYPTARLSRLYGKQGNLHLNFSHEAFVKAVETTPHKYLITYGNDEQFKLDFSGQVAEFDIQYGMDNVGQSQPKKAKELMITNY